MRHVTLCLALVGGTAHATPPNVVTISDIYLGANADQVFLLRTINDNLGMHAPSALDIYLLARAKTGTEPDEAWPLRRKIFYGDWEDQPDQDVAVDNPGDAFAIMADRGAWPAPFSRARDLPAITYEPQTIHFQSTVYEGWRETPATYHFAIEFDAAMAQLNDSHTATRAVLDQYPGMNGGTDNAYDFDPATFATECEPLVSGHLRNNRVIDSLLVEFDCKLEGEEYIGAQVYLVVPVRPDSS